MENNDIKKGQLFTAEQVVRLIAAALQTHQATGFQQPTFWNQPGFGGCFPVPGFPQSPCHQPPFYQQQQPATPFDIGIFAERDTLRRSLAENAKEKERIEHELNKVNRYLDPKGIIQSVNKAKLLNWLMANSYTVVLVRVGEEGTELRSLYETNRNDLEATIGDQEIAAFAVVDTRTSAVILARQHAGQTTPVYQFILTNPAPGVLIDSNDLLV